jgi:phosphoglycolate phosphatase
MLPDFSIMYGRTLVFDLDGTLVDSAPDLHAALNASLNHANRGGISLDDVHHLVGQGARVLLERGLSATGGLPSDEEFEQLFNFFLDFYQKNIAVHSLPYEGVLNALIQCRAENATMAVCTNKPEAMARQLLDELELSQFFKATLGGDSLPVRKPHKDHIHKTIEAAGGSVDRAIMIGDSVFDIEAAKNSEVPVIAVSFGYTDRPVIELNPTAVIHHFDELIPTIRSLF